MTTLQTAGYIVCDDIAIWGRGETATAAWADMVEEMRKAGVAVVREFDENDDNRGDKTLASGFSTGPATAALLQQVEDRGGNIAWGQVDGIYCTREEQRSRSYAGLLQRGESDEHA